MLKTDKPRRSVFAILLFSVLLCGLGVGRAQAEVVSQNRFTAPDAWEMGNAMASSGNILVVGDQYWNLNLSRTTFGNAYVFTLVNGQWTETGELTAADGQAYDLFGSSVAISGNTIIVGAARHNGTGAAYVFTLGKGKWVQQQELLPADGIAGDHFGCAVAISGTTLAVGSCQTQQGLVGSVYTYTLNTGTWQPQAEWASPSTTTNSASFFGAALSLSGTTLLVGAPGTNLGYGAAYLYTWNGSVWSLTASLSASDATAPAQFGSSVVTNGSVAIVGAPERSRAYAYTVNNGVWSLQTELAPLEGADMTAFGHALALSGSTLVVTALNAAEVGTYVYAQSNTGWTRQAELAPSDHAVAYRQSNDQFGTAVAVVGSTIAVSRPVAWPGAIAAWAPLGEVYTYAISGALSTARASLNGDGYGYATAVSGSNYAVGVPGYSDSAGAVYTFQRTSNSVLKSLGRLVAVDSQAGDGFGSALAFYGNTLVVGAPYANNATGSIYVYTLMSGNWTLQEELTASDGQPGDQFGFAVSLSGSTLVAGAPGRNGDTGGVYAYTSNGTAWSQLPVIVAGDGQSEDGFGTSVGLDGVNLVVGSPYATTTVNATAGAAYVYTTSGGALTPVTKLAAANGQGFDQFGAAVAISGGLIAVGSLNGNGGAGAAYTFMQSGGQWTPQTELTAFDVAGNPGDQFGSALALAGATLVVGDYGKDTDTGQVYVFTLANGSWSLTTTLTEAFGQALDEFGAAVAISGNNIAIGAPNAGNDVGSLFAY